MSKKTLPPPYVFGVDEKYDSWRPQQDEAVTHIVDSQYRLIMPVAPTGFGKSLMYVVAGLIDGGKVCILTSTRALEDQLMRDHSGLIVDIRGKDNYKCIFLGGYSTCGQGPCNWGYDCQYLQGGCLYYDQVRRAIGSPIVSTNYAYWMNARKWGGGMIDPNGENPYDVQFDTLVCDEGHELPEIISNFLTKEIIKTPDGPEDEADVLNDEMYDAFPHKLSGIGDWVRHYYQIINREYNDITYQIKTNGDYSTSTLRKAQRYQRMWEASSFINAGYERDPDNMVTYKTGNRIQSSVVWPYAFTESALLKGVKKIVATSATITNKTLELLGLSSKEVDTIEVDHPFKLENRMLYHIPTVRMNRYTTPGEIKRWLMRIDQICKPRTDRKGIIHCVSYARQRMIMEDTQLGEYLISHTPRTTQKVVERFKAVPLPAGLVSPVMTTGYDFPDDECRFQIIGKIAYPDTSDPIVKKRLELDRDYVSYIAMQKLVQTTGRGVRKLHDWCENFIIDDSIDWFMRKNKRFAPKWFRNSVSKKTTLPEPRSLT